MTGGVIGDDRLWGWVKAGHERGRSRCTADTKGTEPPMPLAAMNDIVPLLACPACRDPLTGPVEALRCTSDDCRRVYPSVGLNSIPVLIDAESSIVDIP